jgi:hypothetical protein
MAFQDYSTNPAANTTIGDSTFIGPNMPRDNVRPALQQLAADGKSLSDTVVPAGSREGKFLAWDASGQAVAATGTGADDGLRSDLAQGTGAALIGGSLPDFPAIVTTLGDALPYLNHGNFFGIKSDGSTDDTLALASAIEAVSNNSAAQGGVLLLKPGATTRIEDETIIKPYVRLHLGGGILAAHLAGGNGAAIRPMSDTEIAYGKIAVFSTGTPGSSSSAHSCIFVGVDYNSLGTPDDPDELDNVSGVFGHDLALISDKDLGAIATGGAVAVQLGGNVFANRFGRIRVLASSKLQGGVSCDWSQRGRVAGEQGIRSSPALMSTNRTNFDNEDAHTTHPHDNHFFDWIVEELSRPLQSGTPDTGTFAARESGSYGNSFERFTALLTTESAFTHHAGDLGFEFALEGDLRRGLRGSIFRKMAVLDASTGHGIKTNSTADNVQNAVNDYAYSPRSSPLYRTDVQFVNCSGRTTSGASAALGGVYCHDQQGGRFQNCEMTGFGVGARFENAKFVVDEAGSYTFSRRQNVWVHGSSSEGVHLLNLEEVAYGNRGAGGYSNIHLEAGTGTIIEGGLIGANANDETAVHAILMAAAGDGNSAVTLKKPTILSHGSGGYAIAAAFSDSWGTLRLFEGVKFGAYVTNKYAGEAAIPIDQRVGSDGIERGTYEIVDSSTTLTGKVVIRGERFEYQSVSAAGKFGKIVTTAGTVGSGAVLKEYGAIDA